MTIIIAHTPAYVNEVISTQMVLVTPIAQVGYKLRLLYKLHGLHHPSLLVCACVRETEREREKDVNICNRFLLNIVREALVEFLFSLSFGYSFS